MTDNMAESRANHTAVFLPSGRLLVVGGYDELTSRHLSSAEAFDPETGKWKSAQPLSIARANHTTTLLPGGKILAAGGFGSDSRALSSAEIYDSATDRWTATGDLIVARGSHSATLLPNGKVLVAGGWDRDARILYSAEQYDPDIGTWKLSDSMKGFRTGHTATLLPDGRVLVAGGNAATFDGAELFDPASGRWSVTGLLTRDRHDHTATLLLDGTVLLAGGYVVNAGGFLSSAEFYERGLAFDPVWQPQIAAVTSPLSLGSSLFITGSGFRGVSGGSGGNSQDSPTDYPVVQLRSLESGQTLLLSSTNWSTNSFMSLPVWNFPPGYALATVFVNGIPSTSSVIDVSVPVRTAPVLTDTKMLTIGTFQFDFTNSVGALFGVLATTNVALPLTNWTVLGGVTELSPGRFQFTDLQATNGGQRFYQVSSP